MQSIVFAGAPYVSGSFLTDLLAEQQLDLKVTALLTNSASLQPEVVPQHTFDKALSVAARAGHHTAAFLAVIAATLKPGASLTVYEPVNASSESTTANLRKALLLGGFVDGTDSKVTKSAEGQLVCVSQFCNVASLC